MKLIKSKVVQSRKQEERFLDGSIESVFIPLFCWLPERGAAPLVLFNYNEKNPFSLVEADTVYII